MVGRIASFSVVRSRTVIFAQQTYQHMADMVLTTKEDRKDANFFRCLIDIEPIDRAVNGQISHAGQDVIAGRATNRKCRKLIRRLSDTHDPVRGMIKGFLGAFTETDIAFEQVVKNQFEVVLALG
jgi:hypothetical protein